MKFEGVKIFRINLGNFKRGAAVAVPCLGIFVGKGFETDIDLLRHEFGHILQYREWGGWFFLKNIASDSLRSAKNSRKYHINHQKTWTEWSANRLSYNYFGKPSDWNFKQFPISKAVRQKEQTPKYVSRKEDYIRKKLDI
ncbi:MAG: hypothetical protein ACK5L7_08390 [Paludibacteraceae bacterium]